MATPSSTNVLKQENEKAPAAVAGQERDKLGSMKEQPPVEREVQINTGPVNGNVVPTIVVEDHDGKQEMVANVARRRRFPAALPSGAAPPIPDWYKVGWRQHSGIDNPLPEGEEKDKSVLDRFINEQFYGAWYHNSAVIVVAVFSTYFLARFGFGWGWLFIVLAFCSTYYSDSMTKFRRNARDDIQRDLVKVRLGSEHETTEWMNQFLQRFWLIYEPILSQTITSSVSQILSIYTPAFLDSLRLTQFTLGTKAPRIDKVRTFPGTDDDILQNQVNPKIVLEIRLGKGLATVPIPVLVENIAVSGLMRVKLKLVNNFPHVQTVDLSFLEEPTIGYELKPIGGETFGFDIANVPGLSSFIRDTTHSILRPMMYDPNVFTLNLEQLLSGKPLDAVIGVLEVTIHSARGIKGAKIGGGTPDPFVALSINERSELAHTKWKQNTYNPTWMETKYILINNLHERLPVFELSKLEEDAVQEGIVSELLKEGKERGQLRYDVSYYPCIEPASEQAAEMPESSVGVVRLVIHQAKELDHSKSMSGELNPMTKLYLNANRKPSFTTRKYKHTNNPVWEEAHEFLCSSKENQVVTLKVRLVDLLASKEQGKDWFPLSGCKTGKIRVSAEWKPVAMAGSLQGADSYTPPIGVVRLWLEKAVDVKNVEAALGGKSDPYIRVQARNVTKGRTEVINNNLNPTWDEIVYIPVHSTRESLMLECMDYQNLTKLHVSELCRVSDDIKYPYESTGRKEYAEPLHLNKGNQTKGTLYYHAEFIPAMKLKGVEFGHSEGAPLAKPSTESGDEDGGDISDTASVNDEHFTPIDTAAANGLHAKDFAAGGVVDGNGAVGGTTNSSPVSTPVSAVSAAGSQIPQSEGVEVPIEELLKQQSGVIVFNVKSAQLSKKGKIEVLMDDGYWPCFSTPKSRSKAATWDYVGEGFLKEIDFGQVWLRLDQAEDDDKDDIAAEWVGDAKEFLASTLTGPQTFTLNDRDGDPSSTVTIETRYIPVPVTLEARESVNNQGIVRVELVDGNDIRAADRSGKSDPFALFTLDGAKVFKSDTKKKTLNPEWNESFDLTVPSRVGSEFKVELFDWNQIEQAKSLGEGVIDLASIEAFELSEQNIPLYTPKHGQKGHVRVRLVFQPAIIAKTRKNTSTLTSTGRALTQIGGLPARGGTRVLNVFKRNKHKGDLLLVSQVPSGQASKPIGAGDEQLNAGVAAFPSIENGYQVTGAEPGTLRVTVVDAKDLGSSDWKPYVTFRVGDKEHKTKHTGRTATPEWNESFRCAASAHTQKIYLWVHDHKTLGKDKDIGEAEVDIWRHIQPDSGVSSAEVTATLRPAGIIRLRLEFDPSTNPGSSNASISSESENRMARTLSHVSPSRFSLQRKRATDDD
ncbi:transmembrane protein [Ephemerocybe angulata]|uniref:Transmembrane protein n=1 Tax=Ephemerocybe angulata TaxID=980116 RepID=A0A8H6II82_9AGAR|nr:transmembrane protein [Tulosesus angulatus]